jgi:hypothetical protein
VPASSSCRGQSCESLRCRGAPFCAGAVLRLRAIRCGGSAGRCGERRPGRFRAVPEHDRAVDKGAAASSQFLHRRDARASASLSRSWASPRASSSNRAFPAADQGLTSEVLLRIRASRLRPYARSPPAPGSPWRRGPFRRSAPDRRSNGVPGPRALRRSMPVRRSGKTRRSCRPADPNAKAKRVSSSERLSATPQKHDSSTFGCGMRKLVG